LIAHEQITGRLLLLGELQIGRTGRAAPKPQPKPPCCPQECRDDDRDGGGQAELLTGIEGASSRLMRKIVVLEG
jgi:hypothetical protein